MSDSDRLKSGIWEVVQQQLTAQGIDIEQLADIGDLKGCVRAICVVPELSEGMRALGESPRDRVVMVRVDEESVQALDAWAEAGAVKSRSEAAALFIREGLALRSGELAELKKELDEVVAAKERLRARVRDVLDLKPE